MGEPHPPPEIDAAFEELGEQRRAERRNNDRRAKRLRLDPLFAATLIAHVEASAIPNEKQAYDAPARRAPAGLLVNLRA